MCNREVVNKNPIMLVSLVYLGIYVRVGTSISICYRYFRCRHCRRTLELNVRCWIFAACLRPSFPGYLACLLYKNVKFSIIHIVQRNVEQNANGFIFSMKHLTIAKREVNNIFDLKFLL